MSWEKEATYVKGFAAGHGLTQTLKALQLAKHYHQGQMRKAGGPYIMHPVRVCAQLIALKVVDDDILAAALLHDVLEDTSANTHNLKLNGIGEWTCAYIEMLSKKKALDEAVYYDTLAQHPKAAIVKIADRCNNISTMPGAFSTVKIEQYIEETAIYILPLCKKTKDNFPEYADQIFSMRYQLESSLAAYNLFMTYIKNEQKKEAK